MNVIDGRIHYTVPSVSRREALVVVDNYERAVLINLVFGGKRLGGRMKELCGDARSDMGGDDEC